MGMGGGPKETVTVTGTVRSASPSGMRGVDRVKSSPVGILSVRSQISISEPEPNTSGSPGPVAAPVMEKLSVRRMFTCALPPSSVTVSHSVSPAVLSSSTRKWKVPVAEVSPAGMTMYR